MRQDLYVVGNFIALLGALVMSVVDAPSNEALGWLVGAAVNLWPLLLWHRLLSEEKRRSTGPPMPI